MKYKVFNKKTKAYESSENCIVTQDGQVAFWDETSGWDVDEHQDDFEVVITKGITSIRSRKKGV